MATSSATESREPLPVPLKATDKGGFTAPFKGTDRGGFTADDVPRPLGRYMLLRRIARGGMGEVFLASTTGLEGAERPVVVKIIRREHAKDPSFIARFLDEARVQAQLVHSGVAQVPDATVAARTLARFAAIAPLQARSVGDVRARVAGLMSRLFAGEPSR